MNSKDDAIKAKKRGFQKVEHPNKKRDIQKLNTQEKNINNSFKHLQLKLTVISPIHIGSGEVYEPTNFVIDNNTLYEFKEEDFFEKLPPIKQEAFLNILNENRSDSFAIINNFIKDNITTAIEVASKQVSTTQGMQDEYTKRVGTISQIEGNNKKVFNEFLIQKIQRKQIKTLNGYTYSGYIVGSSLKGAISTAYQEKISKENGEYKRKELFQSHGRDIVKNIFKDFKVSDSKIVKASTKIGFSLNKERFKYDDTDESNNIKLSTYIEIINQNSEFTVDVNYKDLDIKEILKSCNEHYLPIFKTILANETNGKEEFISEYLEDNFYNQFKKFTPKENQYLVRVGKHSGARAVTIGGERRIEVKESKFRTLKDQEEETTTWLFGENPNMNKGLLPFGWLLVEII